MNERTGHKHFWNEVPKERKKIRYKHEPVVECVDCGLVLEGIETLGDRDVQAERKLKRMGRVP
jgi:ribosomal protein L34E